MPLSKARLRANANYQKRQDNITIRPDRTLGARIRAAAAMADQSTQKYIIETLVRRMDADGVPEVVDDSDSEE